MTFFKKILQLGLQVIAGVLLAMSLSSAALAAEDEIQAVYTACIGVSAVQNPGGQDLNNSGLEIGNRLCATYRRFSFSKLFTAVECFEGELTSSSNTWGFVISKKTFTTGKIPRRECKKKKPSRASS